MALAIGKAKRALMLALVSPIFLAACQSGLSGSSSIEPIAPSQAPAYQPALDPAEPLEESDVAADGNDAAFNPFDSLDAELDALDQRDQEPDRTRVAILVPQTGRGAKEGQALVNAASMALFDFRNEMVDLVPYDTQGNPDIAASKAQQAVDEGADIILGPLLSSSVKAVSDQLANTTIPVLSFSNNRDVATSQTHVTGFMPEQQILRLLEHAQSETLYRIAMIVPNNRYGELIVEDMRYHAPSFGIDIPKVMTFAPGSADYSDQLRSFSEFDRRKWEHGQQVDALEGRTDAASRAALRYLAERDTAGPPNYDAVILAVTDDLSLRTLSSQLAYFDVDQPEVRIMGLQLWDSFSNLQLEPALIGAQFVAPTPKGRLDFAKRYARTYGKNPLRLSSIGYDTMALVSLMALNEEAATFEQTTLTNPQGFIGMEGLFRLMPDGVSERGLAILEVRPDGIGVLKEAPETFPQAPEIPETPKDNPLDENLSDATIQQDENIFAGDPFNALETPANSNEDSGLQTGF